MKTTFHLYIKEVYTAPSSEKSWNKNILPNQTSLKVGTRAPSGLYNAGRAPPICLKLLITITKRFADSWL